jgi:hypothetical protein
VLAYVALPAVAVEDALDDDDEDDGDAKSTHTHL